MSRIFIGMMLVFLNFNLDLGASRIGLIPTFLGYIVMYGGLKEIAGYSGRFPKVMPYVAGMGVYTGVLYAMDLFGISVVVGEAAVILLAIVSTVLSLFISYNIVMGVRDIEAAESRDLDGEKLFSTWKLLAVFSVLTFLLVFVPGLGLVSILGGFIVGIAYLVRFNRTKNLFNGAG